MMTRNRLLLALGLIVLPFIARLLFFYQFPYFNGNVVHPDYAGLSEPIPPTPSFSAQPVVARVDGKVVLVDYYHGNQFDRSEIEPLVTAIHARGARVEYDTGARPLDAQLKYASAYIVFSPSIAFLGDELRAIQQFVATGGRLLVFADPTRSLFSFDFFGSPTLLPDVNYTNPLLAPYGLTFANDYLYNLQDNEGNFRNVKLTDFDNSPITQDLNMVVFYGAHSVQTNTGSYLASGSDQTLSSLTDRGGSLSSLALSADGQVLASGDFTFLTDPFNQVADNALLLGHLADFSIDGERSPQLANFPYLFTRPVSLVTTASVEFTPDFLSPISSLQKTLNAVNIPVNIRAVAPAEGDTIVLGTFSARDEIDTYLSQFGMDLDGETGVLSAKGVGQVNVSGGGLILFSSGPAGNTLVLLAPTPGDLPALITLVASGDLSACVIQESVGVCSLGSGSGSFDGGDYGYYEDVTPTPFEEFPTETPAPTPAG